MQKAIKRTLFLFLILMLSVSAKAQVKIDTKLATALKGTWVKTSVERDTLEFKMQKGLEHTFYLLPERSTKPPRYPQGAYSYTLKNDSISAQWLYSVYAPPRSAGYFYFKLDPKTNTLIIGNFYNAPGEGRYLRFIKVDPLKKEAIKPEN